MAAKAAVWAQRIDAATDLGDVLHDFFKEIGEVAAARGGTPNAVEGAVREQKSKFMAMCRLTSRVNEDMWRPLMAAHGVEYMKVVNAYLKSCESRNKKPQGKQRGRAS